MAGAPRSVRKFPVESSEDSQKEREAVATSVASWGLVSGPPPGAEMAYNS